MHETNESIKSALAVMPSRIASAVKTMASFETLEEIRLRVSKPPQLIGSDRETMIEIHPFTRKEATETLERLCHYSVYAWEEELRKGFVMLEGGARVGVCGHPMVEKGKIIRLTNVTCFNMRIAREVKGCAEVAMPFLASEGKPYSALIAAPPGGGKTTILRDIARCFSSGIGTPPVTVGVADERNELSGCVDGVPSFDLGLRTDIMESAPKTESISMLVRSMNPSLIITDELGGNEDVATVRDAARCGVAIIAGVHANSMEELIARPTIAPLIEEKLVNRVLILNRNGNLLKITPIML